MKKNLIKNICNLTEKYCEKEFNDIIKKLNITMVTLTMKQKDDIKEDDKYKIDIKNEIIYKTKKCD